MDAVSPSICTRTLSTTGASHYKRTHQVLDEIPVSDTYSWNRVIHTHLSNQQPHNALSVYHQMLLRGVSPDRHTLPRVLAASRYMGDFLLGKQLHGHAYKFGFSSDHYVVTALIDMYGCLDTLDSAKWAFYKSSGSGTARNSVSWTVLARLYLMHNKPRMAVDLFYQMVDLGAEVDDVALATVIGACAELKSIEHGRKVHAIVKKCGLEFDVLVSTSLMRMYMDCGSVEDATVVFEKMPSKDVISWTAMIGACVKNGEFNDGLKLLRMMIRDGVKPDAHTLTTVLPACARVTAHKNGKEIHGYLLRNGIDLNVTVQNAIMDMYVKSGFIGYAVTIFAAMKYRDLISWTVMILGYSLHGQGVMGVTMFREMEEESRIAIDEVIYAAVLQACSTARMVEDAWLYFNCIKVPKVTHCALMVAVLARAGCFNEARLFIQERSLDRHPEVLGALLDGCRIHKLVTKGKQVIEQLCELEPLDARNYVMLSNWYANCAKWDMVNKLREMVTDMGLESKKACSWIEFRNKVHVFSTGDVHHPRSEAIYWELKCLMKKMGDEGHRLNTDFSFHDVDEERECIRIGHSEMLAISFGLISTQTKSTIRVAKNLRMCTSCHDFVKFIAKTVEREIIIKDPNCFHHFKDGYCSCGDFW